MSYANIRVKLELKMLKVKFLTKDEQAKVNGGILSIGFRCSLKNTGKRIGYQVPYA